MCDPVTLSFAAVQAYGTVRQGQTANDNAQQQGDNLDFQGQLARDDARAQAARIRREGEQARGATVAAVAGAGAKVGQGSALDAERQVMTDYKQDEYLAILTGERQANAYAQDARQVRKAGRDARRAGYIAASTSLLMSGAQGMKGAGWRANGQPGFSGTQVPAPIESRMIPRG